MKENFSDQYCTHSRSHTQTYTMHTHTRTRTYRAFTHANAFRHVNKVTVLCTTVNIEVHLLTSHTCDVPSEGRQWSTDKCMRISTDCLFNHSNMILIGFTE